MYIKNFKLFYEENQYKNEKIKEFLYILESNGYNPILSHSQAKGNKIILNQMTNDRSNDYNKIFNKDFIQLYNPEFRKISGTSEPGIYLSSNKYQGISIVFKESKKQSRNTNFNKNETWFVDQINSITATAGPINLNLISSNKLITINNIESATWYGNKTATSKNENKADIILNLKDGKQYPISIKHTTATFYASLVSDNIAETIGMKSILFALKNNLIEIKNRPLNGILLSKTLAIKIHNQNLLERWMFGDDIKDTGLIMVYDYFKSNFVKTKNGYDLNCDLLIENYTDINEKSLGKDYPILFILNHKGKHLNKLKGINARLGSKKRLTKNVVTIDEKNIKNLKTPNIEEIKQFIKD